MCATACEAVWLRKLLEDVGEEQTEATMINCDNQSSIKMAYNLMFHKNTKHIDTQFHFGREKVRSKEICVEYYNSCNNIADIFTKPLGRLKFELFKNILGVFNAAILSVIVDIKKICHIGFTNKNLDPALVC